MTPKISAKVTCHKISCNSNTDDFPRFMFSLFNHFSKLRYHSLHLRSKSHFQSPLCKAYRSVNLPRQVTMSSTRHTMVEYEIINFRVLVLVTLRHCFILTQLNYTFFYYTSFFIAGVLLVWCLLISENFSFFPAERKLDQFPRIYYAV